MPDADLVLMNVDSTPVDGRVRAIGVTSGRISHLWDDAREASGRTTWDCAGATVLPGIDDSHLHGYEYGRALSAVDVSTSAAPDLVAVQRVLRDAEPDSHGWIRGIGWDSTVLRGSGPGGALTATDLDVAAPHHPVLLTDMTGHQAWVNSEALRRAGLDGVEIADPDGGSFLRGADGRPSGVMHESAVSRINDVIPQPTRADKRASLLATQADLLSQGVVAYTDPGLGPGATTLMEGSGDFEAVAAYQELDAGGELLLRVNLMLLFGGLGGTSASEVALGLEAWGKPHPMPAHGHLGISQVKVFADGIPRSRTAWMSEPYDDCTCGHLQIAGDSDDERVAELGRIIEAADSRGWQIGLHTIGDRAITTVVDAMEGLPGTAPERRHYVIHGDFVVDHDLDRMSRLGMTLNANPSIRWAVGGSVEPVIGAERNSRRQRLRDAWDAGVNVCLSSDAPVAPPDWRVMVAAAMTRSWQADPTHTDAQRLSASEAITALTRNAAWQSHAESWRGELRAGMAADLVIMDRAVDWSDPWSLTGAQVQATMVAGALAHGSL